MRKKTRVHYCFLKSWAAHITMSLLAAAILTGAAHATSAIMPVKTKIIHCPKASLAQACSGDRRCCKFLGTEINILMSHKESTPKQSSGTPLYNYDRTGFTDIDIESGAFIYIE